jgi:hypothetical protein
MFLLFEMIKDELLVMRLIYYESSPPSSRRDLLYKRLPLRTVAAIGGNLDILKRVCSIGRIHAYEYNEMTTYAVMYQRIEVFNFCFDRVSVTASFMHHLLNRAIIANCETSFLITLYHRCRVAFDSIRNPDTFDYSVYRELLIEFGFRRVINYYDMIFPEEFENVDLYRTDLFGNNKLFIYALYNNVYINHDRDRTNYSQAIAAVCVSKKASIDLLYKLIRSIRKKHLRSTFRFLQSAIENVIDSMYVSKCI